MSHSGLLAIIRDSPHYQKLLNNLSGPQAALNLVGLPSAAKNYLIGALAVDQPGSELVISSTPEEAKKRFEQVSLLSPGQSLIYYPEMELFPPDFRAPRSADVQARLSVAWRLLSGEKLVVFTSLQALLQPTLSPVQLKANTFDFRVGQKVVSTELLNLLGRLGYEAVEEVTEPGTFSRRGGLIDIFPPSLGLPIRLELFGDTLESLRTFDPLTQRSVAQLAHFKALPAHEFMLEDLKKFARVVKVDEFDLSTAARQDWERDLEKMSENQYFEGIELYSAFIGQKTSLLDYGSALAILDFPDLCGQMAQHLVHSETERIGKLADEGRLPKSYPSFYLEPEAIWGQLVAGRRLFFDGLEAKSSKKSFDFSPAPNLAGQLPDFLRLTQSLLARGLRVVVSSAQAQRLSELFEEKGQGVAVVEEITTVPPAGSLTLTGGGLTDGFLSEELGLAVFSDREIFGWIKPRRAMVRGRRLLTKKALLIELKPGDYVVHVDHGVGRFEGFLHKTVDNVEREYLLIQYAQKDRLYLPTEQVDRITRYSGGPPPALNRLSGTEWTRSKAKVKAAVNNLAKELLELYAAREAVVGHAFGPDSPWQLELEQAFPYAETEDQLSTINEVKQDMERPQPMDRLVCGDVGYGKTEVALRAAFKAVLDGKQVAVLVPTTVLAQQHYQTFSTRLAAFPVRVTMLSRFSSPAQEKEALIGLAAGTVDICIGTHRLLQKDVRFKDLGLVVIDEEQRFGVRHKEHLKQLRREVDVLTLSATPIPRTLNLSLVGARDVSVMETPPEDRLPISTYVGFYSDEMVREAIERELDRGGQVYVVSNRVKGISAVADKIRELVPYARVVVGHGQLEEQALARVMTDFTAELYDVLVCTTIIESGLDIPNVNTIIINRADRFGLSQLYQLRGRVGRGANRAYAYLLYDKERILSPSARKRLGVIFETGELGSGLRLALYDLEIRGAGNVLGPEQHGFIAAVGYDLYTQLLEEAIAEQKGLLRPRLPQPTIELPLSAFIPDDYIPRTDQKLLFYRRMADVESEEELFALVGELRDRFGPLPAVVDNLIFVVRLKLLARRADVSSVKIGRGAVLLQVEHRLAESLRAEIERLSPAVIGGIQQVRLKPTADASLLEKVLRLMAETGAEAVAS